MTCVTYEIVLDFREPKNEKLDTETAANSINQSEAFFYFDDVTSDLFYLSAWYGRRTFSTSRDVLAVYVVGQNMQR